MTGPGAPDELTRAFEAQRPRLLRVAYASLGSVSEAEDCVQEAWLRLRRMPDPGSIRDLGAWLTTAVSRLAYDALGSARARREHYAGAGRPAGGQPRRLVRGLLAAQGQLGAPFGPEAQQPGDARGRGDRVA